MIQKDLITKSWGDYELLDSGENMKLERFGEVILTRPETQAVWSRRKPNVWSNAGAEFSWGEKGKWNKKTKIPSEWDMKWGDIKFIAKLTNFKHVGVFPEQEQNWDWIGKSVSFISKPKVLNLFGYTGIASIVAAEAGALVTHVDSSKQSIAWAKQNAERNKSISGSIRYICDDALKFSKREVKRGVGYDGIIIDPPAFGRGAKGEVWKIERDLRELLKTIELLLSKKSGSFFLLNGYAAGYSSRSFYQVMETTFGAEGEYGELCIEERDGKRFVPSGIYSRFVR